MTSEHQSPRGLSAMAALAALTTLLAVGATLLLFPSAFAATAPGAAPTAESLSWGLIGAALATGMSALGAGIAVGKLGAAAVGALAEKPELFGRLLIFVGLAEGIAIYGLIISILILNRLT
ncbi:MAG TPA: ATP synthase subunit C [Rhodocyclaceae bacterium]|nr:ATP synthase subunit C [Rhodocyclaceae bacterium]